MQVKILQKMYLLKMSGPHIWLCLFTFRLIASKQLNGLNTIASLSWFGGAVVTICFGCKRSRVQSPVPARVFMFDILFCCCCVFTFCLKHIISHKSLQLLLQYDFFLVYLTYCNICDWLYEYKDTDLASLSIRNKLTLQ